MEKLLRAVDRLSEWTGKLGSFLVVLLIGIVVYDILTRDLFRWGNVWVYDISMYLFSAHFLLGGAYAHQHGAHVGVDVFVVRLSARARAMIDSIMTVVFLVPFSGMVLWWGGQAAVDSWRMWERSIATPWYPVIFPLKTLLPFAFLLLLLQALAKLIRDLKLIRSR